MHQFLLKIAKMQTYPCNTNIYGCFRNACQVFEYWTITHDVTWSSFCTKPEGQIAVIQHC